MIWYKNGGGRGKNHGEKKIDQDKRERKTGSVIAKASAKIGYLRRLGGRLDPLVLRELFLTCIRPAIEYTSVVWAGLSATDAQRLERCNRSAARLITGLSPSSDVSHDILLACAGFQTLGRRRQATQAVFCCRALAGRLPQHLQSAVSAILRELVKYYL